MQYAEDMVMDYADLINAANSWQVDGKPHILDKNMPDRVYPDAEEFWEHYKTVTGRYLPDGRELVFIGCSC